MPALGGVLPLPAAGQDVGRGALSLEGGLGRGPETRLGAVPTELGLVLPRQQTTVNVSKLSANTVLTFTKFAGSYRVGGDRRGQLVLQLLDSHGQHTHTDTHLNTYVDICSYIFMYN